MKQCLNRLLLTMLLVAVAGSIGYAQGGTTSATLSGSVLDQSGGAIPGAGVKVRNDATGAEYNVVSNERGLFSVPALNPGTYTATVSMTNFKTKVVKEIKIDPQTPAMITVTLEVGGKEEVITVQANTELVQSQSANISTTLSTNQIINLPLTTRNLMDFLVQLPGVNTTAGYRYSDVNSLSGQAINITIDGTNTQDNYNKSGDGFFSMIVARPDGIQEVTISTATPGAESAGQGAIQIKFVTRSGNNDYHGSLYEYHKNPALDSNYWFTNRSGRPQSYETWTPDWKAPIQRVLMNQFGGRIGGPFAAPKWLFGPLGFSGKDKAFFFINYEELRQPNTRQFTNTEFDPVSEAQGIYKYQTAAGVNYQTNLYSIAQAAGQTSTPDPLILNTLGIMRASLNAKATMRPVPGSPNYQYWDWYLSVPTTRKYVTTRGDFNVTSKQRIETSWNYAQYVAVEDTLNGVQRAFPDGQIFGTQGGNRFTATAALRSTITPRLVNEARIGINGGTTVWYPEQTSREPFAPMDYYNISYPASIHDFFNVASTQRRCTPLESFDDTLSWTKGSHSFSFGMNFTNVGSWYYNSQPTQTLSMGLSTTYDPAYLALFSGSTGTKNFPAATSSQISDAENMYATLTGRVTSMGGTLYLNEGGHYQFMGPTVQRSHLRELAIFASDAWRLRPNVTLTYGLRWDLQFPFVALNDIWSYATVAQVWGPSGVNSRFTPGASGGVNSEVNQAKGGVAIYNKDWKTFAPSFGIAWTPNIKGGIAQKILGSTGQSVFRGGYALAYNRYGMGTFVPMFSGNPGGTLTASRTTTLQNFPHDGCTAGCPSEWPVLLRDITSGKIKTWTNDPTSNPNPTDTPSYPIAVGVSNNIYSIDPNIHTPYTQSWSVSWQREVARDTVIEMRYVGNRSLHNWNTRSINEYNYFQSFNGYNWFNEFKQAAANLHANLAFNNYYSFRYTGSPGTGPLPITLAYLQGVPLAQATDPSKYTSSQFQGSMTGNLGPNALSIGMASSLQGNTTYRANALTAGLPANLFIPNPYVSTPYIIGNNGWSAFDGGTVELRRRMAKGLMINASYQYERSENTNITSYLYPMYKTEGGELPHVFKVNWMFELPIGKGRLLFSDAGKVFDRVFGGWQFQGVGRVQCCNMLSFGAVKLQNLTVSDLRGTAGLRFNDVAQTIYYEPEDIRQGTIAAYSTSASYITGYTNNVVPSPTARAVMPSGTGGCLRIYAFDCVNPQTFFRGPYFMRFDLSLVKVVRFTEQKNFEIRGEFLNAFNNINFNGTTCASSSSTCGNVTTAFQDTSQQADYGGRVIQIQLRINF